MEVFDKNLTDCITVRKNQNDIINVTDYNWLSIDEHNPKFDEDFKKVISNYGVSEANDNNLVKTTDMFDLYINMEVVLPRVNDGELYHAMFKRRTIYDDEKPLVVVTCNPIIDTRIYEVQYPDGAVETLSANVVAENLLPQVNQ